MSRTTESTGRELEQIHALHILPLVFLAVPQFLLFTSMIGTHCVIYTAIVTLILRRDVLQNLQTLKRHPNYIRYGTVTHTKYTQTYAPTHTQDHGHTYRHIHTSPIRICAQESRHALLEGRTAALESELAELTIRVEAARS